MENMDAECCEMIVLDYWIISFLRERNFAPEFSCSGAQHCALMAIELK